MSPPRHRPSAAASGSGSRRIALELAGLQLEALASADEVYTALTRVAVPMRAEMCILDVVVPGGTIRTRVMLHADPAKGQFVRDWAQRNPLPARHPVHDVVASGQPLLCASVTDVTLSTMAVDEVHLAMLRRHGPHAFASVPLVVDGDVRAVFTCAFTSQSRRFSPSDFDFLCELGAIASAALRALESRGRAGLRSDVVPSTRGEGVQPSRSVRGPR